MSSPDKDKSFKENLNPINDAFGDTLNMLSLSLRLLIISKSSKRVSGKSFSLEKKIKKNRRRLKNFFCQINLRMYLFALISNISKLRSKPLKANRRTSCSRQFEMSSFLICESLNASFSMILMGFAAKEVKLMNSKLAKELEGKVSI